VHKASRKRNPNSTEANIAAVDSTELPHTPLIVEVTAKIIDHPFISLSCAFNESLDTRRLRRSPADLGNATVHAQCHLAGAIKTVSYKTPNESKSSILREVFSPFPTQNRTPVEPTNNLPFKGDRRAS
jgi:hypothetical protein